jgi:hypothetical protein
MKRNKLQIKQEIKKHFSNNNSNNNSNVVMQRDGVITEYNDEEDSQCDDVKYKCKCYKKHLNSKSNNNNNKRRNKPYFVNYTSPYGKLFTDILKERDNMN